MFFDPATLPERQRYKIATGTILPRPIAWVSSMDGQGRLNLAPFSYFTVAATDPLTLIVCPQLRAGEKKDNFASGEEDRPGRSTCLEVDSDSLKWRDRHADACAGKS